MEQQKIALITGASQGLGFVLAQHLAARGWKLLITARRASLLREAQQQLAAHTEVVALSGDVRDEVHLLQLAEVLERQHWSLDLVVNNASALGAPLKPLLDQTVEDLHTVLHTNTIAPISLLQKVRPYLREGAKVINVSSDAAAEAYPTWGAYGGSKAGLDHMTAVLNEENTAYTFYAFDPGDMRTQMHQAAFPDEDISDRPLPSEAAVPALLTLADQPIPGGRYTIHSLKEHNYEIR